MRSVYFSDIPAGTFFFYQGMRFIKLELYFVDGSSRRNAYRLDKKATAYFSDDVIIQIN